MSTDLVSVVVPIYNVAPFLKRSLISIRNQLYKNIEVLLVDDGSTDSSASICQEFVNSDNRFVYLRKENGGVSSARNYGLARAKGRFVCFVDSDDFVSPDYVGALHDAFDEDTDITICDYALFMHKKGKYSLHGENEFSNAGVYTQENKNKLLLDVLTNKSVIMPVWKNMYRVDFLKNNNLFFQSEREIYTEDQVFNLQAYFYSNKTIIVPEVLFYHLIVEQSLSHQYRPTLATMFKKRFEIINGFLSKTKQNELLSFYNSYFTEIAIDALIMMCRCSLWKATKNVRTIIKDQEYKQALSKKQNLKSSKQKLIYFVVKTKVPFIIALFLKTLMFINRLFRRQKYTKQCLMEVEGCK